MTRIVPYRNMRAYVDGEVRPHGNPDSSNVAACTTTQIMRNRTKEDFVNELGFHILNSAPKPTFQGHRELYPEALVLALP